MNNFDQLEVIVENDKPHFICLSETHVTDKINENEIRLEKYYHYSTNSNSTRTGGIILYTNENWQINKIIEKVWDYKYWISAHQIKYKNISLIIAVIYRSPSSQENEFFEVFEEVIEEINEKNIDIIITGDFNIDWSKDTLNKRKIESIINDNGLMQVMQEYTRVTNTSRTVTIIANISRANKISDHEIIEININTKY